VPQVEVTFDIDANGILNVGAKDKATGKEQNITITASSGLSDADVDRMVKDAEAHEAEDQARRESIEARNKLDSLIYNTKKLIEDNGDKIPEAEKLMVEEEIKNAEQVLEANKDSGSPEEINAAFEALQTVTHKLAEVMYKGSGGDGDYPPPGADAGGADEHAGQSAEGDVIDAEFEETT